ncbi:MAG TPA: monovalent cation:proton antiporter-2 (CPA2) family protein [Bauldia sp.]|nr:monovalent cation:proton antiporter-2 (CPA2) family protein [Bauldia sp.]
MTAESHGFDLIPAVALLGSAVIAVPIFKRLGLGTVLGYLAAGLAIGPFGIGLFTDPAAILQVAELGVVMLLFVIGLEMRPARLWNLRREIFGLGVAQVAVCAGLLTVVGVLAGFPPGMAFVAGAGFVLTSTAVVLQVLQERGETNEPSGQKIVSILLLEDLAIVPLLAIVAFLAPMPAAGDTGSRLVEIGIAVGAIAGVYLAGRFLLNPLFRVLAAVHAREIMTAAALLVVLGAALLTQLGGLSMAMGAFLAGVVLSESTFRHELEADIEPFRGLLLGLFFLSVGMSLNLAVIATDWPMILAAVVAFMAVKGIGIYLVARTFRSDHAEALRRALLMAQGGEFAFVLYASALAVGLFDATIAAVLNTAVIISMALTPLAPIVARWLLPERESFEGVDKADGLEGRVLLIGFGRFGQVTSQALLARGVDVSIIDSDTDMIRAAGGFGFKIYYGDGTRLDVLRAAGAGTAEAVLVAINNEESADKIVELVKAEFPLTKLLVRSFDRGHSLRLVGAGVDYQIRETFESAMRFGEAALLALGVSADEAAETLAGVRSRDEERFAIQMAEGIYAGRDLMLKPQREPTPTPLSPPKRAAQPLSAETAAVADGKLGGKAGTSGGPSP